MTTRAVTISITYHGRKAEFFAASGGDRESFKEMIRDEFEIPEDIMRTLRLRAGTILTPWDLTTIVNCGNREFELFARTTNVLLSGETLNVKTRAPISGVRVLWNNQEIARTDIDGHYQANVPPGNQVSLRFEHPDFVPWQKQVTATSPTTANPFLIQRLTVNINSVVGGTVSLSGAVVVIPPNALLRDGQPFTGQATVTLTAIQPSESGVFPTFEAGTTPVFLETIGATYCVIRDQANKPLTLATEAGRYNGPPTPTIENPRRRKTSAADIIRIRNRIPTGPTYVYKNWY